MSLDSLMDKEDRDYERRERREAERIRLGLPKPVYTWKPYVPPDPTPTKKSRRKSKKQFLIQGGN